MTPDLHPLKEAVTPPSIFDEGIVSEPMSGVTNPDPYHVSWAASGLYDGQEQQHRHCLPVTGCRVTVHEGRTLSYGVQLTPLLDGADADTPTRLVHTESEEEVIEWVDRAMEIVAKTPSGWALAPRQSVEEIRWLSLDEDPTAVELWQEDRNMGERREWTLLERGEPEGRRGTRSQLETGLLTDELPNVIRSALADHPKGENGNGQADADTPADIAEAYYNRVREREMVSLDDGDWQLVGRKVHSYLGNGVTADKVEWYGIDDPEDGSSFRLIWRHRDTPTFLIATTVSVVGGGREPKAHVTINGTKITVGVHHHDESVEEILDWIKTQAETVDIDSLYDGDPPAFGLTEVKAFGQSADSAASSRKGTN